MTAIDQVSFVHSNSKPKGMVKASMASSKGKLLIDPTTVWYELPYFNLPDQTKPVSDQVFNKLYQKAQAIMEAESSRYSQRVRTRSAGDKNFLSTILRSGTVTDKVSALTILVQEAPIYSLKYLKDDLLEGMAKKKSRREAILAIDSIKDLMTNKLLPDRKLRYLRDQPLEDMNMTEAHLLIWYFEDTLKNVYFELIKTLEALSHDTVLDVKIRVLTYIHDLLVAKPEQEHNLLLLLVNKLGDLDRKVAVKAVYQLTRLLSAHPNMKMTVIKEVQCLLFRPNISSRAQYVSLTFLNQIVLSNRPEDVKTANYLVEIYFTMFERLIAQMHNSPSGVNKIESDDNHEKKRWRNQTGKKKKIKTVEKHKTQTSHMLADGIESKMMTALLTGVNRAFPFSKLDDAIYDKYLDKLFQFSHIGNFSTTVQALSFLFQVQSSRNLLTDRYYRALYGTLFDPRLYTASRQAVYLNLLFRSLKLDPSLNRTMAILKRLVQACTHAEVPFVCASLFMVGEIMKVKPGLSNMMSESEAPDIEVFKDIPQSELIDDDENGEKPHGTGIQDKINGGDKVERTAYDARKRDPLYANAQLTCFWEMIPFTLHFHPTVSLYATTLLRGKSIEFTSALVNYDPLQNHTLTRFLDRFVYKNPRVIKTLNKGPYLMQPRLNNNSSEKDHDRLVAGGRKRSAVLIEQEDSVDGTATKRKKMLDSLPVNDASWMQIPESELPVDEVFFRKYFKARSAKRPISNKAKEDKVESDCDMEEDDEINGDEVMKAILQSSSPLPDDGDEDKPSKVFASLEDFEPLIDRNDSDDA